MSEFTPEKINELADLLLIGLSEEETQMVLSEFDVIDKNINLINEIEGIKEIQPMTHALDDFHPCLREDEAEESISKEDAFNNCDNVFDSEIVVPKVVG